MPYHRLGLVLLCVSAAACDAPATTPLLRADDAAAFAQASRGIVASATGGGTAELPPGFGLMDFSYAAHQHADGRGLGTFHQSRIRNGLLIEFDGEVTCVAVDVAQHRAWIGGIVTRNTSTDPAFMTAIHQPGRDVWFRVADNGEGNGDAADRTTVFGFTGSAGITTSAQYCAAKLWPAGDANTFPLVAGNLQVRQ